MRFFLSVMFAMITDILSRVLLDASSAEGLIIYFVSFLAYMTAFKEIKEAK
jgi:hypothetical protein